MNDINYKGFHTINGGTPESATEIGGAPGITRDVGQEILFTRDAGGILNP